jgi:hypothetical protein
MMRTYWLSFVDDQRPPGQRFLGACIVQVSDADEAACRTRWPNMHDPIEGPWIAAATRKAWQLGCNPGGQVAAMHLHDDARNARNLPLYPLGVLMSKQEIERIDATIAEREKSWGAV